MGNKSSTTKNNTSLAEEIDRIASKYILSQNFNDMNKLSEKGHCDKVVFLTAKIIDQNLNPLEQKEMVNRIDNGMSGPIEKGDSKKDDGKKDDDEDDEGDEKKKEKKKDEDDEGDEK